MQVRGLDFKRRDFKSVDEGGLCEPGKWFIAKSIVGDFEIHQFSDREGFYLFWPDQRRGIPLESLVRAKDRACYEYEQIILGEMVDTPKEGLE